MAGSVVTTVFNSDLTLLENLTVSDTSLSYADQKDFSNLKSLKYLDLSGNAFADLPSYFLEPMKHYLQKFIMKGSGLEKLLDNAIRDMPALTTIDLSNNYIEQIGDGNFENIPNLNILNLHGNNIPYSSVNKNWFSATHDKIKLNLSHNNFNGIPEAVLKSSISVLDLTGNNISMVPVEKLCVLSNMSSLILADNPLHCDTFLEELFRCLPEIKITGKCKTPLNIQDCLIHQLSICLMKSSSSSLETIELVTFETTTTKRLMSMVKEESDVSAIVRPIVTFQYTSAEVTDKHFMKNTETTVKQKDVNEVKISHSNSELIYHPNITAEQNVQFYNTIFRAHKYITENRGGIS
ncbi:hypothetical protein Btru_022287 [Bulinus truncatus]|nr:hypothetical protein Btru_022287 [Bulinus truncatus]